MLNLIALPFTLCLWFLFISRVPPKSTRILEILAQDSTHSPRSDCRTGNIGDSIHEAFSEYGEGSSTFSAILSIFNGAKFRIKVDLKEKLTVRYSGEVYQGICSCIEWRIITGALVGIRCTGGFADMSGRKL